MSARARAPGATTMAGPTLSQVRCLPPHNQKEGCMQLAWRRIWHALWRGLIHLVCCQAAPNDNLSPAPCALARKARARPRAGLLGRLGSLVPGFARRRPSDEAERPAAEFHAATLRELREREARERDALRRGRSGSRPGSSACRGAR